MGQRILLLCAVPAGLAAGYGWSVMTAPAARTAVHGKSTMMAVPPSPEERPLSDDQEWTTRADDAAVPAARAAAQAAAAGDDPVTYVGCNAVRAAGKAPLYAGEPGYRTEMDGDRDGIACEPYRGV
jgi:hypothetical protein